MSESGSPPPLDQYPGYFPAAKPPFWTRLKAGVTAGLVGLVVGLAWSAGGEDSATPPAASGITEADVQARVDAAVGNVRDELEGDLAAQKKSAATDLAEARRQATTDLRLVKKQARASQRQAVSKAVASAEAKAAQTAPAAQPFAGTTSPETDPRFNYCYEANAAGYGNYVRGQDPEYAWYDDADNDGVVCEF